MRRLVVVILLILLGAPTAYAVPTPEVRIGVLVSEGSSDLPHTWQFLGPYLERALPQYRIRIELLDLDSLRRVVTRSDVHFFIGNSGFYVEMESGHGASAIATIDSPNALSPDAALGSAIVVLDSRGDLRNLRDLRGKHVVAVNDREFCCFQTGLFALSRAGVSRDELGSVHFVGSPATRLLEELEQRGADAAILRVCLLERLTHGGAFRRADFRVLGDVAQDRFACARSTPLYPDWPFARAKTTSPELAKQFALALLSMPRTPNGYAWTVPTDYASVHEVFRELEIGPYQHLNRHTLSGFLRHYWYIFAGLFALGLAAAFHVMRSEALVARRTSELRQAMRERDRIAEQARAREEQIEHLSRLGMLGEMASMVAHELNQPLSAIGNFANGIIRRIDAGLSDPKPLGEASEEIARQAERAAGIMQRIRGFARKQPPARSTVDLREVIDESVKLFGAIAPGAGSIERRDDAACAAGAPAFVERLQIEQVLLNLFTNAYDAMRSRPAAERRLSVTLAREQRGYRIAVTDNGVGVDRASLAQLFEPFYTTKPQGVGLGLAICKRVVEAHGGRIFAALNAPAPGLTISFTVPELNGDDVAPVPRAERAVSMNG